jgi:hypothetical protein
MKINFIREQINNNNIKIKFVRTRNQVADILTKALPKMEFRRLKDYLLNGFQNSLEEIEEK